MQAQNANANTLYENAAMQMQMQTELQLDPETQLEIA